MVGLEIIDLFAEDEDPEVFADELYSVQRGGGSRFVGGESAHDAILSAIVAPSFSS